MMKKLILVILLIYFGEITASPNYKTSASGFGFIENKGQLIDQNHKPNKEVLYLYSGPGLHVQLKPDGFSYEVWNNIIKEKISEKDLFLNPEMKTVQYEITYQVHRIDISFLNASKNLTIKPENAASYPIHYYTGCTPISKGETGTTNVLHYAKVIYPNIYPNIDIEFLLDSRNYSDISNSDHSFSSGRFKYNFIIHPGGNVNDIKLKFDGANATSLNSDGHIIIETDYGSIEESIPASYQYNNNNKQEIEAAFKQQSSNIFGIAIAPYNQEQTLIIDPVPYSTYYGGSGEEWGQGIATDSLGNVFITGYTKSTSAIATSGAYQNTFGGGTGYGDAFLVKFDSLWVCQWATYFGGDGDDATLAVATDASGNVIITGFTKSDSGIATTGAYQIYLGYATTNDAFIAKFDSTGICQWATYYGGSGNDYGYGVATDLNGNIIVVGSTYSTTTIATTGAHQTTFSGTGTSEGFIVKFNSSGVRQWGTYYGGLADDECRAVAIDLNSNIFVTGITSSTINISTSGVFQTNFSYGIDDGFVVKFNALGVRQWGTYFGGNGQDFGFGIAVDLSGNSVIAGYTSTSTGMASAGAHQTTYGVGATGDAFFIKFNPNGTRQWSTYYGGSTTERGYGYGVVTDSSNNIFFCGATWSPSGIATAGSFQPVLNTGNYYDGFVVKFNPSGVRQWGSYYGGNLDDKCLGIAIKRNGDPVITGYTRSTLGLATGGAFQTTYGGIYDAFIASLTNSGILPVKLISFEAKALQEDGIKIKCNWSTASEINNDYFEIERSINSEIESQWLVAEKKKGHGTTNIINTYEFIDDVTLLTSPSINKYYYRLKQVDFDGNYAYSNIVLVNLYPQTNESFNIYPNPNTGLFTIDFTNGQNNKSIMIYDFSGKLVKEEFNGSQKLQISMADLAKGIYLLKIITDTEIISRKIVLQ